MHTGWSKVSHGICVFHGEPSPQDEVDSLMKLLRNYMKTCLKTAAKNDMKVRVLGDISRLDDDIRSRIQETYFGGH